MKITLTNLTTAILILTVQMFFEWTLSSFPQLLSTFHVIRMNRMNNTNFY
jgi:hypothetical protein